jgi:hypothetical protein
VIEQNIWDDMSKSALGLGFSQDDVNAYLFTVSVSNFNAIMSLAAYLARDGILNEERIAGLHDAMSKPLSIASDSTNELIVQHQARVDDLLAELRAAYRERRRGT